jgi:hypothetical protein
VRILNSKYPLDIKKKHHLFLALLVAFWIFLFLFFAEPFKIDRFTLAKKLWTLPIYGLIQASAYLIVLPYQNNIIFNLKKKWSVKNEVIYFVLVTIAAWIANYAFYIFFVTSHENTYSFIDHAKYHFLPGLAFVLPIFIVSRYVLGFLYERNLFSKKDYVQIGEGKTNSIRILKSSLTCIKSDDNYLVVYYFNGDKSENKMVRGKLSEVIKKYPEFKRVHRSYVINPFNFKNSISKSGNLFLILKDDMQVPVSRNIKNDVKTYFNIS